MKRSSTQIMICTEMLFSLDVYYNYWTLNNANIHSRLTIVSEVSLKVKWDRSENILLLARTFYPQLISSFLGFLNNEQKINYQENVAIKTHFIHMELAAMIKLLIL